MKVMFCLPDMTALGVQRVVAALAHAWPRDRVPLAICLHERRGELLETLPRGVEVLALSELGPDLPKLRVLARPLLHARAIAAARPDAIVSFVPGDNLSLLALRQRPPLAVSEHIHVSSQLADYPLRFRLPYVALFPRWYPKADAVVCIAEESREDLVSRWKIPRAKTVVIHNPVDLAAVRTGGAQPAAFPWPEGPVIVCAGRLARQKRLDRLLDAFAIVRRTLPAARLALLGDGPLRAELEARARPFGDAVWFAGFEANPWRYIAKAQVLALSSDYEGFPCVLAEALALGTPIVSTACPSGPRELLDGGRAGLLVEELSAEALAVGLLAALQDPAAARARAQHGRAFVERYTARAVAAQYVALCEQLTTARP